MFSNKSIAKFDVQNHVMGVREGWNSKGWNSESQKLSPKTLLFNSIQCSEGNRN